MKTPEACAAFSESLLFALKPNISPIFVSEKPQRKRMQPTPQHSQLSEPELVNLLKEKDDAAYVVLYDNYSALLYGVMKKIVAQEADLENLLQDCFVKIWKHIDSYDSSKGKLATWLLNIARNLAIDFTRSRAFLQQRKNQELEHFVHLESEGSNTRIKPDTIGVKQLVEKLNPSTRQVIEWMYFDGYTQQEIADEFGIPLGTVKTRTRMGLKELRTFF
jgi:RNA polymerase sigma-70 factor, ECF subfamily